MLLVERFVERVVSETLTKKSRIIRNTLSWRDHKNYTSGCFVKSVDFLVNSIVTGIGRKSVLILDNLGLSAVDVNEKFKESGPPSLGIHLLMGDTAKAKLSNYITNL